jgi:hypothetical protein
VYHILNYTPCPFTADIQQLLQDAGIMLHVKCKSLMPLDAFFEPGQKMVCKWDDATLLQMVKAWPLLKLKCSQSQGITTKSSPHNIKLQMSSSHCCSTARVYYYFKLASQ